VPVEPINRFRAATFGADMFRVSAGGATGTVRVRVIVPTDGELVTSERTERVAVRDGCAEPRVGDPADVAFIAVVNRYTDAPPAVAFIHGFGLGAGAIAASVAHDCHNVVAVGGTREALAKVVNAVFQARGGLAVHDGNATQVLPLPIAGLMSDQPFARVAADYERLTAMTHAMGSPLRAPFMTLSFMALLVIPALKLSDQGLFDGRAFRFTEVVQGP
jgi:adenine deaminase